MIQNVTRMIWNTVSRERMRYNMMELSRYSRVPIADEFNDAASYIKNVLERDGIEAEFLHYSKPVCDLFRCVPMPPAWDIREGWCELCFDGYRRIADYHGMAMSVAERCGPCPEGEYELIILDRGSDPNAYSDIDFNGKMALCPGTLRHKSINWVYKKGAVGTIVVTDKGAGMQHITNWMALNGDTDINDMCCFAVCANEGKNIIKMANDLRKKGGVPRVRCYVDARFHEMPVTNLTAFIPGETEEEVLMVAHLCHPQGSCNDNLSGCIAGMEAMRVIKRLLDTGAIKTMKRGIRLLLVPEILGSAAFVTMEPKERLDRIVAGVNLDMVGANQNNQNGIISVTEPPHANPGIVTALCAAVLNTLREDVPTRGFEFTPLFNARVREYGTGSDHVFFCDPQLGIPMPMVGQGPDKYYHTSGDTHEVIDYFILAKSCALAAAFSCTLADMTRSDAAVIAMQIQARLTDRIALTSAKGISGELTPESHDRRLEQLNYFYGSMYDDFKKYFTDDGDREWLDAFVKSGKAMVENTVKTLGAVTYGREPEFTGCRLRGGEWDRVLRRIGRGSTRDLENIAPNVPGGMEVLERYNERVQPHINGVAENQCDYLIDGRRTVGEVVDMARREVYDMISEDVFYEYIITLEKLGLCEEVK